MRISYTTPRQFLSSEIDIILRIQRTLEQLASSYEFQHVKGHQDDNTTIDKLPWPAQLNIHCNDLASQSLMTATPTPLVPVDPIVSAILNIDDRTITRHITSNIREACSHKQIKQHLQQHHKWSNDTFENIAWSLFHKSSQSLSLLKRFFQIKLLHRILPLNNNEHKYGLSPTPYCPSQCQCRETFQHSFKCPHLQQQHHLKAILNNVSSHFKQHNGDPYNIQVG